MREIKVRDNNGRCLIRFSYQGKPYSITQGNSNDKAAVKAAEQLARQIYLDCLSGNFDSSLAKYKPQAKAELTSAISLARALETRLKTKYNDADKALLALLTHYGKPIKSVQEAQKFIDWLENERKLAPSSVQRYLNTLKAIAKEWFSGINVKVPAKPMPKPFSKTEVAAILAEFKTNRYYSHYHDYVYFLFLTGCRTSEAIGIRWQDVDFARDEIAVYESLGRCRGSSSKRERKTTKTNKSRVIPCKNSLKTMLLARKAVDAQPSHLVFTNPKGLAIDDHSFSQRCWKSILAKLGIAYRTPYTTRHTFISHCLEAGMNPVSVAKITGHDVKTLFEHYAGVINKVEIPELF